MPRTPRLLAAALAFATLSLSPFESFAGPLEFARGRPLQVAVHRVPPDWLTRTGPGPRQTRIGMSCGNKLLLGLGIGAGIGAGLVVAAAARQSEAPREAVLSVPLVLGGFGAAAAYNMCR